MHTLLLPLEWVLFRPFDKPSENLLFLKVCLAIKKMCETSSWAKVHLGAQPYSFSPTLDTSWVFGELPLSPFKSLWIYAPRATVVWWSKRQERGANEFQLVPAFPCTQLLFLTPGPTMMNPGSPPDRGNNPPETSLPDPFVALLWQLHMPDFPDFPTSYDLFPCAGVLGELVSHFLWSNNSPF